MREIDISNVCYAAKWGLTDFYEDSEQTLNDAYDSGEDFRVRYGCKKEIRYAEIIRDENGVYVKVTEYMDDLYKGDGLIYDALWARCDVTSEVPEEIIEEIRESVEFYGLSDFAEAWEELPRDASLSDLYEAIERCEFEAEEENKMTFHRLCNIAEECYTAQKGE